MEESAQISNYGRMTSVFITKALEIVDHNNDYIGGFTPSASGEELTINVPKTLRVNFLSSNKELYFFSSGSTIEIYSRSGVDVS